jgi:phospholipid/cholesterol/gamma-HCH transport system substrate-binding protein
MKRPILTLRRGLVLAGALLLAPLAAQSGPAPKHVSADFSSTVSLYKDAPVRILGVTVGHVSGLEVDGNHVHVDMTYDRKYRLGSDVHAVIVPPSVAGDRFIQLAPAYASGPTLADHANIPVQRTAVPQELDDTYQAVDELAKAIGPNGANRDGALSDLLRATDKALAGNASAINSTVRQSATMLDTLADHRDDFTSTITNLNTIVSTLAADDPQVRSLSQSLGQVGASLNAQHDDIANAVTTLNGALHDVAQLLDQNGKPLTDTLAGAVRTTNLLTQHTKDLADMIDSAPVALTSLNEVGQAQNYNPAHADDVPRQNRANAVTSRANFFADFATQLGYVLNGMCRSLPSAQTSTLANLCPTLQGAGGNLGTAMSNLLASQNPALTAGQPALSLLQLLGGGLK